MSSVHASRDHVIEAERNAGSFHISFPVGRGENLWLEEGKGGEK